MAERVPTFQYATLAQQHEADALGMWAFLATELLFFGALVAGYFAYRVTYGDEFIAAARHTNVVLGTANTAVLLTSSACMAMAVYSTEERARRTATFWFAATALLGLTFLGIKGYEYFLEYREQLVPALNFATSKYAGVTQLFFIFYFVATGLHALHLTIGILMIGTLAVLAASDRLPSSEPVRMIGLYWHFVDMVWIFLFPLIYLAGRNA
jgi:cytochrome c oxidase subunit 3